MKTERLRRFAVPAVVLVVGVVATPSSAQPQGWKAYYGNLHAHTAVSDGVGRPAAAFAYAKQAGTDFLCLSEHNHDLSDSNTTQAGLAEADVAATKATASGFVGLVGQEFSTIKNGNHVNVYDVATQIPAEMLNDYRALFEKWLPEYQRKNPSRIVVAQFNHPENDVHDYGRVGYKVKRGSAAKSIPNYEGDDESFRQGVDAWVRTIAILSGPADVNQKTEKDLPLGQHRDIEQRRVGIWHRYLDLGLHLSPVADQDNHSAAWGNRTSARTGIWVQGAFTRESILRAIKSNRTFASEDPNLSVWFSAAGQAMGSRIAPPSNGRLAIEIAIRDADEPSAHYVIELYREVIGDGLPPEVAKESGLLDSGQAWKVEVEEEGAAAVAYLAKVTQLGDGTGKDDVWTAPVWIDPWPSDELLGDDEGLAPSTVRFVGSRRGDLYHLPECRVAQAMRARGSLIEFPSKPEGRHLHEGCPR